MPCPCRNRSSRQKTIPNPNVQDTNQPNTQQNGTPQTANDNKNK